MKLSVILVSVNIAATLPLVVAAGASAEGQAKSDTAEWLKSSLASLDTSVNQKKSPRAKKVSYSTSNADSLVMHSNSAKMRPFVPNRKLPSQRDLDVQFIAQQAKMGAVPAQPDLTAMTPRMAEPALAGKVSEVYGTLPSSEKIANYGSIGYVKQTSSRVMPGQVPSAPGQIRQFKGAKKTKYVVPHTPTLEEVEAMDQQQAQAMRPIQPSQSQGQFSFSPQSQQAPQQAMHSAQSAFSPQQATQPLSISADEQAIIDRMMGSAHTGVGAPVASMAPPASVGPPPFPLSLLPQDQLKSIIKGMRRPQNDAPPSYFGSWRGGNATASLPTSGFHTYPQHAAPKHAPTIGVSHRAPAAHSTIASAHTSNSTAHTGKGSHSLASVQQSESRSHGLAQLRRLTPHDYAVAEYASYSAVANVSY